jgi:hypothetical protein
LREEVDHEANNSDTDLRGGRLATLVPVRRANGPSVHRDFLTFVSWSVLLFTIELIGPKALR